MKHGVERRALVTGGAGFVGHHLIERLLREGCRVVAVDNFSTGVRDHVSPFRSHPGFELRQGDITDAAFMERLVALSLPDIIYHLAAIHFIPYCIAHPGQTLHVNVMGTQRLLDAMERARASRFILASTADVYAPSRTPHAESAPLDPLNIYGLSKLFSEQLLALAQRRYPKTRFLTARFFNIYGPGETNPHVLPDILAGLRNGNLLQLGNMEPRRDYVYVSDVVEALLRLGAYEGTRQVFNVGTGVGVSVWDLVNALEKVIGSAIRVETDPAKVRAVERRNLVADISLARRELKWSASVSLEEGLENTVKAGLATRRGS